METYRLKNIIISILALLNVFLLFLLINFRWQSAQAHQEMLKQLHDLFTASEISLAEDLNPDIAPLPPLSVQRDLETEFCIAALLLGTAGVSEDQGGGIYAYTAPSGSVRFRSDGSLTFEGKSAVSDPEKLFQDFCQQYGYTPTATPVVEAGTYTAVQTVDKSPIYNSSITFQFQDRNLISVSGYYVPTAERTAGSRTLPTAADALIQFLNYRNQGGIVCKSILDITPVYERQSSPSAPLQLAAKWQITTDTYRYYVDCITGDTIRA